MKTIFGLKLSVLNFVHTNSKIVEKLIHNLNSTGGAGFSEIPSKVIKYSYSIIAPILTALFNHISENKIIRSKIQTNSDRTSRPNLFKN